MTIFLNYLEWFAIASFGFIGGVYFAFSFFVMQSLNELNYTHLNELSKFIKPSNFKNFLNNKITGPILYENAINKYENIIERQIEKFYKVEVDYANNSGATIFNNEKDYDRLWL